MGNPGLEIQEVCFFRLLRPRVSVVFLLFNPFDDSFHGVFFHLQEFKYTSAEGERRFKGRVEKILHVTSRVHKMVTLAENVGIKGGKALQRGYIGIEIDQELADYLSRLTAAAGRFGGNKNLALRNVITEHVSRVAGGKEHSYINGGVYRKDLLLLEDDINVERFKNRVEDGVPVDFR